MEIKPIAYIHNKYGEKFGIPRQGSLADGVESIIIFEKEYRSVEAVRELEGFSHLWLIWQFSLIIGEGWHPTVRPPKLGGNKRVGVFASRSPYRPNSLGLSCVKIKSVDLACENAPIIRVTGADLMDGTPIFDIKPYVPMCDCFPEAREGYTRLTKDRRLSVVFPEELRKGIDEETVRAAVKLIEQDPRPGYSADREKVFHIIYGGFELSFRVEDNAATVTDVRKPEG